ncbi:hypothetical protein ANANG_G00020410 [Anguilla anguilla]|uniref:CLOCK-interacting pacemaker b n=1 Tax=Anguilla anguilla TaxID=7936 RepID=A0A9D3N283_ANGAN|nr:hypothetical protein ANANG_G00020410 [Anguilla anguilla]
MVLPRPVQRTVVFEKTRITGLVFSGGRCSLLEQRAPEQAVMSSKAKVGGHRRLSSYVVDSMKTSKPESERDSGFSDGSSGYLSAVDQMDSEDTGRRGSQAASQVAVMTGSYPSLSPMIIMNNVVLKQPNTPAPALKPWGFQPTALEMLPQPQVVFLQPVVSNSTGASHKSPADKRRKSRKYLPILKSYPKIAPHPGEGLSEKASSSSSSRPNGLSSGQERRHRHRQRRDALPACPFGAGPIAAASASPALPPETDALVPWAWPAGPESHDDGSCLGSLPDGHSKQQRFCNTYNILHRSGLLGITLRTKELIRQNRRTQGQLEQLRQHAGLFVEAVCSDDPQVWTRLQLSMMETGSAGPEEQEGREEDTLSMLP